MEDKKRQTNTFRYCESVLRQNFTFGKMDSDGAIPMVPLCMVDNMCQASMGVAEHFARWIFENGYTIETNKYSNKVFTDKNGEQHRSEHSLFLKFEAECKIGEI